MKTRSITIIVCSMIIAWSSAAAEDSPLAVYKWMQQLEGNWVLSPAEFQEGKATSHNVMAPMVGSDQVAIVIWTLHFASPGMITCTP